MQCEVKGQFGTERKIKILELFGGIGAPRRALMNIGVDVKSIDYVEIDQKAVNSYNAMFKNEMQHKTQTVVGYNLKPDILIHGSPCQDFSIAGYQKGADEGSETRSSLMWETIHIIEQMGVWKPRVVIWENVKNVTSKHMIVNFNRYMQEMEKLGYTSSFQCLNAMEFGLPQKRERVITVSMLGNERFEFDDLIKTPPPDIKELLQNDEDVSEDYTVNQPSLLSCIGKTGVLKRLSIIDTFCYTITTRQDRAPNSGVVKRKNGSYRFLTPLECFRMNGFKDEDFFAAAGVNGKRELWKQAGNTMPVNVLESIFRKLLFNETQEIEEIQMKLL